MTQSRGLNTGDVLAERYRLERPLGRGGMGEVWAGTHVVTLAPVAVKLLSAAVTGGGQGKRRFLQEAQAPAALDHPNVIRVIDAFVLDGGQPAIVMDRLEGEPLNEIFKREEALPVGAMAALSVPVLEAVAAAHDKGLVHRDLKPGNLFLARRAGKVVPVVLDFGLVKLMDASHTGVRTQPGVALGTPAYMAPEQARGEPLGPPADLWAMGVVLYRGLSGMLPIEGKDLADLIVRLGRQAILPLSEIEPDLPPELTSLVMAMLNKDPRARPSAGDAAAALRPYVDVDALARVVTGQTQAVTVPDASLPTAPTVQAALPTAPTVPAAVASTTVQVLTSPGPTWIRPPPAGSTPPMPSRPAGPQPPVMAVQPRGRARSRRWLVVVAALVVAAVALVLLVAQRRRVARRDEVQEAPDGEETRATDEPSKGLLAEGRPLRTGPFAPQGLYLWREDDGGWVLRLVSRGRPRGTKLEGSIEGLSEPPVLEGAEDGDEVTKKGDAWHFTLVTGDPDTIAMKADGCVTIDLDAALPSRRIFLGRERRHPPGSRFTACPP